MANTTGSYNTALGQASGGGNETGSYNTWIGIGAGPSVDGLTNTAALGCEATVTASNTIQIGDFDIVAIGGAVPWTVLSDGRFKKNIQENVPGLAFINELRPITYTWDIKGLNNFTHFAKPKTANGGSAQSSEEAQAISEKEKIVYTGFIAQDVEAAAQKLNFNFSGVAAPKDPSKSVYTVRYSEFVVPLVKAVQELSSGNDTLAAQVNNLQASVNNLQTQVNSIRQQMQSLRSLVSSEESLPTAPSTAAVMPKKQ